MRLGEFSGGIWALCLSHKTFDIMSVVQMKSIYMHSITNCEPFLEEEQEPWEEAQSEE